MENRIKIGYTEVEGVIVPVTVPIQDHASWNICGNSGSGKTIFCLLIFNQLLNQKNTKIWVADFKGSGDYADITPTYATGEECIPLFLKFYEKYLKLKSGEEPEQHIYFVWDEFAGNIIFEESMNKKRAEEVKKKMAEILMMGRALPNNSSAGIFTVLQRPDANYYAYGSRINYSVSVLLGKSTQESRKMMGFDTVPDGFQGGIGKGLILTNENPVPMVIRVPYIEKSRLKKLLKKKGAMMKLSGAGEPIGT